MNRKIIHVVAMVAATLLAGCRYSHDGLTGTLVDSVSGDPISDAFVSMAWGQPVAEIVSPHTECVYSTVVKTDSNGRFTFPPWSVWMTSIAVGNADARWNVYKKGFDTHIDGDGVGNYFSTNQERHTVKSLSGDPEAWMLSVADTVSYGCESFSDSKAQRELLDTLQKEIEAVPGSDVKRHLRGVMATPIEVVREVRCKAKKKMWDTKPCS